MKEGQIIGMLDGSLISVDDNVADVLIDLVNKVDVKAGDLITLYYGAELKEENAAAHAELIKSFYGDVDIEVYNGGQPYYHYFVSFE